MRHKLRIIEAGSRWHCGGSRGAHEIRGWVVHVRLAYLKLKTFSFQALLQNSLYEILNLKALGSKVTTQPSEKCRQANELQLDSLRSELSQHVYLRLNVFWVGLGFRVRV